MNKIIILLFLISIHFTLFAQENLIVAVAKQNGDIVEVKAKLRSPMVGVEEAKRKDVFGNSKPIDYITHIKVMYDKDIVFDLTTCQYLAAFSRIDFQYHKLNNTDTLKFFTTDHKNKTFQRNVKIKNFTPQKSLLKHDNQVHLPIVYNQEVWKAKTVNKAINILYAPTKKIQKENLLKVKTLPKDFFNTGNEDINYIQSSRNTVIYIQTDIALESIAILSDRNRYSLAGLLTIPANAIINYTLAVKTGAACCQGEAVITVIAKGIDGTLYIDESVPLTLACSTTDGSCY